MTHEKLAEIENDVVVSLIIGDKDKFPDRTDVTDKYIGVGFTDNGDGTFTDNRPKPAKRSVVMTSLDFFRKLTDAERTALRGSAQRIKDLKEDLEREGMVRGDAETKALMVGTGLFDARRADELFE